MNENKNDIVHGDRMIKISLNLWTNGLPDKVHSKTAWNSGVIHVLSNKNRRIKHDTIMFKGDNLLVRLQELLDRQGIDFIVTWVEEIQPVTVKKHLSEGKHDRTKTR